MFAGLKGAVDAGLEVPYGESVIPGDDRITGQTVADYADQLDEEELKDLEKKYKASVNSARKAGDDIVELNAQFRAEDKEAREKKLKEDQEKQDDADKKAADAADVADDDEGDDFEEEDDEEDDEE